MLSVSRISTTIIAILAFAVALASYRFVPLGLSEAFGGLGSARAGKTVLLAIHVSIAPIALILGIFQFFSGVRDRWPRIHRAGGWIYVTSVAVSGVAGLLIAPFVPGGWVSGLGFGLLSVFWLVTTGQAVFHARKRDFVRHRRWMTRSYALTLAAVTLRIYLPLFFLNDFDYDAAAPWLAWLCWVPNIIAAEILVRQAAWQAVRA